MKKLVKVFGLLAVIACLCLSVAACGDTGVTGSYEGTLSRKTSEGDYSATVTIVLKSDNTVEMIGKMSVNGQQIPETKVNGTYKVEGEKLTITLENAGEDIEATIKSGKIIVNVPEVGEMELKKK